MMSEVFKTATPEATETKETAPESRETPGLVLGETELPKAKDLPDTDRLDVWETENKRQYAQDYFGIRETAHIFPISAHFKNIDKYVKIEIANREYENTKENYDKIIGEIEDEIGTKSLISHKRIQKIFDYIQVIQKINKLKEKKKLYTQQNG